MGIVELRRGAKEGAATWFFSPLCHSAITMLTPRAPFTSTLMSTLVYAPCAGKYLNAMRECGQHVARPVGGGGGSGGGGGGSGGGSGGGLQYGPHGQYVQQVWREGRGEALPGGCRVRLSVVPTASP